MVNDTIMPMAWNEPGNGKSPDPFNKSKDNKSKDGPPDLDQVFKQLHEKLMGMFGSGKKGSSGGGAAGAGANKKASISTGLLAAIIAGLYILSGFYIVKPAEQGVVTRFGKYTRIVGPGPHWYPQFIEDIDIENTQELSSIRQAGTMLTGDENLVSVEVQVQYSKIDINSFLFKVVDPEKSLRQAAESALRQAVGQNKLDFIITSGRAEIEEQMRKQIVTTLDSYNVGLHIAAVTLKEAKAPEQVKAAFDDVTKAREDRERFIHEAESYYNKIVPEAKGQAQQMLQEAEAYKQEAINAALGETQRFSMMLPEYRKAPKVTKTRLYLDALEQVLSNSSKVMIDVNAGNNMIYLPLEQLIKSAKTAMATVASSNTATAMLPSVQQVEKSQAEKNDESAARSYDRRREN